MIQIRLPILLVAAFAVLFVAFLPCRKCRAVPQVPAAAQDDTKAKEYPTRFDWGTLVKHDQSKDHASAVELRVSNIPKDGKIKIPRFNNSFSKVFVKTKLPPIPLKLHSGTDEWTIQIPKMLTREKSLVIMIETVGDPNLIATPFVCKSNKDGTVALPAHHAICHGKLLRFEPQPHKNTVGYWANENDWCEWKFELEAAGEYEVWILQGCGKGQGGSRVELSVGDQTLEFEVEDTGHFQNFKKRKLGSITIAKAGAQQLQLKPIKKARNAVMDVREVRLVKKADD